MTKQRIRTGKEGEAIAAGYLAKAGYRIVERNYRCPFGEVDIIAREGGTLAFVEVKSRREGPGGDPKEAMTSRKQRKLSAVALFYLKQKRMFDTPARFDVVAVRIGSDGHRVELIRNAFDVNFP